MATFRFNKGSNSVSRSVVVTDAFVQAAAVEVEIEQPAHSLLTKAYIRCVSEPTLTADMDLGFKIGTSTGGTEISLDADGIIDEAGNTTAFKTGAMVQCGITQVDASGTDAARAAQTEYTEDARTLFCNTTASAAAIAAAGKVEWVLFFEILSNT
tara:strand:+ start:495 stop:959 length:465 start_codon:yes stop_codon:yes gene_type:complete